MLNKIMDALNNLQEVRCNINYKNEAIADVTKMYNDGWDLLADETVILTKGNLVAVKKGNLMVKYQMADFRVTSGKLIGNIVSTIEEKEVREDLKNAYLAQAIITKYYTLRRA